MKLLAIALASLFLCVGALGCGSDELLQWSCVCTGAKTTFVCATNTLDAQAQAFGQICTGVPNCDCTCENTYIPFGC